MKYKISDIAHLFEILGGIAIIVSLIFVGVQLQSNTRATKSASAIAASTATADWYTNLGSNEQNSTLFRNFYADPGVLSPEQRFQAIMNLHGIVLIFQNNFYLANEGTLDPEVRDAVAKAVVVVKDQPGWKLYWKERRVLFLSEFQDYIDLLMKEERQLSPGIYKQPGEG